MMEFALLLPVVLVVLFGIFEFGLAFWRKQILTAAVREGARAGVQTPAISCADISTIVTNYLANAGFDANKASVSPTGCPATAGNPLTVAVTYPSSFLILSRLEFSKTAVDGDGNIGLTATITMQGE